MFITPIRAYNFQVLKLRSQDKSDAPLKILVQDTLKPTVLMISVEIFKEETSNNYSQAIISCMLEATLTLQPKGHVTGFLKRTSEATASQWGFFTPELSFT